MKGQTKMDLSTIPKVKTEKKTINKKWKLALQEYCDKESLTTGQTNGYCVCGYMEYCDLCEGADKNLPCVKAILKLAKEKNFKIDNEDYDFEKLLEEL